MNPRAHTTAANGEQIIHFKDILSPDLTGWGIGVDIMEIDRMRRQIDRQPDLVDRIFTTKEIAYCRSTRDPAVAFAERFAAKEAFMKALGGGLQQGLRFSDIELTSDNFGRLRFTLLGRAAEFAESRNVRVTIISITHSHDLAVATVVMGVLPMKGNS